MQDEEEPTMVALAEMMRRHNLKRFPEDVEAIILAHKECVDLRERYREMRRATERFKEAMHSEDGGC